MATPLPSPLVHTPAWDEALSAFADGEDPGFDRAVIDTHLAGCARCRDLAPGPDLSRRVVDAAVAEDRAGLRGVLRLGLAVIGMIAVWSAASDLVGAQQDYEMVHATRHLGAFTLAYGVGLLVVAVRPARARTMLPVSVVLGAALVITAVIDISEGHAPMVGEASHLPELISVALLWVLARSHGSAARGT